MVDFDMPTTKLDLVSPPSVSAPVKRVGFGKPTFLPDKSAQLDVIHGCPALIVAEGHLARKVLAAVELLDLSSLETQYSKLGRHAVHPRHKLGVLLYGSLAGVHEASKLAKLTETDAATRLVSGGHAISATGLRTFRRENADFFAAAIQQTIELAVGRELVDPESLAVDSVRVRAEASTKSIRTAKRSEERLEELEAVDTTELDADQREAHEAKVAKHRSALERCRAEGRTSLSVTNELAGLLKFPNGASLPGHRVTIVAAGVRLRFVLAVLIGSEPNDYNLLGPAVLAARDALNKAGLDGKIQVAGDAGYVSQQDLQFAMDHRDHIDVLVNDPPPPRRGKSRKKGGFFSKAEFDLKPDGTMTCPAGRTMQGPAKAGRGQLRYRGEGCAECPLKAQCTDASRREVVVDPERERLHGAMKERMTQPDAAERYRKRIATVEPVFSYIEDAMGYRRASSRHAETVKAEILLKVLAYNLLRLVFCACDRVALVFGTWDGTRVEPMDLQIMTPSELAAAWAGPTSGGRSYSC